MSTEKAPLPEAVRECIQRAAKFFVSMGDKLSSGDAVDQCTFVACAAWEAAAQQERARLCTWTAADDPDTSEVWETTCGHSFQFNDGGPVENHMAWCGYCGGKLMASHPPPTPEDR